MELNVAFELLDEFAVAFESPSEFTFEFGVLHEISASDIDVYQGEYDITPQDAAQTLKTNQKLMTDDVRVHPVPYIEIPLSGGGIEVKIGG